VISDVFLKVASRLLQLLKLEYLLWASELPFFQKLGFAVTRLLLPWRASVFWCGVTFESDNRLGLLLLPSYLPEVRVALTPLLSTPEKQVKIVDVGSNVGQWAVTASAFLAAHNRRVSLTCIEPCRQSYEILTRNCRQLSLEAGSEMRFFNVAISSRESLNLFYVKGKSAQASFSPNLATKNLIRASSNIPIMQSVETMNTFSQFGDIDLLKVDTEGGEEEVLKCLGDSIPRYLWLETSVTGDGIIRDDKVRTLLSDAGLDPVNIGNRRVIVNGSLLLRKKLVPNS